MSKFKKGDRARILHECMFHGLSCTIVTDLRRERYGGKDVDAYFVDVDGYGAYALDGKPIGFEPYELAPISPPHQEQWEAFKKQYLVPDKRVKGTA